MTIDDSVHCRSQSLVFRGKLDSFEGLLIRHKTIHRSRLLLAVHLLLLAQLQLNAGPIVLNFESLTDLESVTNQFPGLTFSNTTALVAGISLNEFDFPPRSGITVLFDDGGPINIVFSPLVLSFSAYFTYIVPLSLEAFDAADSSVALAQSLFSANDGFTGELGSSPNELLQVFHGGGLSRVVITGDVFGSSFTMDDVSVTAVPEPSGSHLIIIAALAIALFRHRKLPA